MCSTSLKNISFQCDSFLHLVHLFEKDLQLTNTNDKLLFQIPDHMKNKFHIYFLQEKNCPVLFPNIPSNTIYIDMHNYPENSIKYINKIVEKDTNGIVQEISPDIVKGMKDPAFNFLLYAILYLKGHWIGQNVGNFPFYNENGTIKKVPYFKIDRLKATIKDGRIIVRVSYRNTENIFSNFLKDEGNFVLFSKPLKNKTEEYDDDYVKIFLPTLKIQDMLSFNDEFGKIILQLNYKQDKDGFEATVQRGMIGTGLFFETKDLYFNTPFKIEIFSECNKILDIDVNNL